MVVVVVVPFVVVAFVLVVVVVETLPHRDLRFGLVVASFLDSSVLVLVVAVSVDTNV